MLKRLQERRLVVAHRGGGKYKENTVAGFVKGVERGCKLLECDVRISKDKKAVVVHDAVVKRNMYNKPDRRTVHQQVSKLSATELSDDHGVPSLDTLIGWMCQPEQTERGVCLAIEIKDVNGLFKQFDNAHLVADVVDTLKYHDAIDRCVIVSFNKDVLKETKRRLPQIMTGYLYGPLWGRRCPVDVCVENQTEHLWVHHKLLNAYLLEKAKATGTKLYVWTVNSERDIGRVINDSMFECVNGIVTDEPELVMTYLRNNKIEKIFNFEQNMY